MAIRKPTAPSERSSVMAEMLAQAGQESKFKNGSLVEGTVSSINGDDVIGAGVERGPAVGAMLNAVLEAVIDEPAEETAE